MSEHFIAFSGGAEGSEGSVLLAINPANVSHITSAEIKEEYVLRIHMLSGRFLTISEAAAGDALEALGLGVKPIRPSEAIEKVR